MNSTSSTRVGFIGLGSQGGPMARRIIEEVVDAVLGGLAAGGVIAVHSTVHPDAYRRLAERDQAGGVRLIDAPVSGGAPAAEAGRLLVLAGGDEEAVEFCRPVFGSGR